MSLPLRSSLVSAVLGGAVVAAVMVVFGLVPGERTTTVVQQAPISRPVNDRDGQGFTPREIYKRDAPGVVNVKAQIVRQVESPFDVFPQEQRGQASGSGFVLDRSGYVLTNAHVIEGASDVTVQFEDRKSVDATVVGKDSSTDIALLRVHRDGVSLHPLSLGDSATVQVGDPTIAIGNPFGLDRTLTTGVVSALQRRISAPNGFSIDHVIQTDAAINPGNSGGPLLDAAGRVIGINSQIVTGEGASGNVGIGFAVPINTAKRVIPQLMKSGRVPRPYIGITGVTIDSSLGRLNLPADGGVLVQAVAPGSPADRAGIRGGDTRATLDGSDIALGGDVIRRLDGRNVASMDDVMAALSGRQPGDTVKLDLLRAGRSRTVTVTLGQRPDRAPTQ
ncbi:MAG TPA: trypsin-like peptidase domain-containing protein [Solirubrobacteraceae bacterium]|jgi:S1-C subfamily serine protease|nr:trypsin-like peptidase domain-containing protein [Solirubrobacteraceae bacterium]